MKLCAALAFATIFAAAPPVQTISMGNPTVHSVALTFDAGSDRGYAAQILKTLERYHVRATFGMTGLWASTNGDLLRRMASDGDAFINHTYDHRSFTGFSTGLTPLSVRERTWEIEQAERVIRAKTGRSAKPYFRPPYGDYDRATVALLRTLGYRYMVMWTIDSLGWNHLSASAIVSRCLALVRPGSILLMHVGSQSQDAQALPAVMNDLRHRGYRFVTVPQLIAGQ